LSALRRNWLTCQISLSVSVPSNDGMALNRIPFVTTQCGLVQLAVATGAVLLIDLGAGEKIGLVRGKRRFVLCAFANRRVNRLVRDGPFQWQRAAFRRHGDSAASDEKITSQQKQTDSKNKTEEKFDHGKKIKRSE
jgi:hypothetical protein